MMETISTFETLANIYQTTRQNIPEDSHLHLNTVLEHRSFGIETSSGKKICFNIVLILRFIILIN
jgi:hypothetical protein